MKRLFVLLAVCSCLFAAPNDAFARDWYVSAERGKGKSGTLEKPAKDLGNIISKLEEGDRVFIAAGTYLGRGENGHDAITVPVEIYGGFDEEFSTRDPWGAHRTIFSGNNVSDNFDTSVRLSIDLSKWRKNAAHRIVVDGVIVDNGDRNRYAGEAQLKIVRTASPKTGEMPTPESGGISLAPWKQGDVVVRNCIVMNTAPTGGAFSIWGHQGSSVLVENNLAINNTGDGFALKTAWAGTGDGVPQFSFRANTSVFHEKHDPFATYGGAALKLESSTVVEGHGNALMCSDYYGIDNAKRSPGVIMNATLFAGNVVADYLEFDTKMDADEIEDESDLIDEAEDCVIAEVTVPVSKEWAAAYASRTVIDRNAAEADVKVLRTRANALRSILGLNLQGSSVDVDSAVWLPRLSLEEALAAGNEPYLGKYGCRKPAPGGMPE